MNDSMWPSMQRGHQFEINIGPPYPTFGGVNTGQKIDFDLNCLQLPGGGGYKTTNPTYMNIDCANAVNTYPRGINNMSSGAFITSSGKLGTIVGTYQDTSYATHAYVYNAGTCTNIDYSSAIVTWATAINNAGEIVGYWEDSGGAMHGLIINGSTYTPVNYSGYRNTYFYGVNDAGQITGFAYDSNLGTKDFAFLRRQILSCRLFRPKQLYERIWH